MDNSRFNPYSVWKSSLRDWNVSGAFRARGGIAAPFHCKATGGRVGTMVAAGELSVIVVTHNSAHIAGVALASLPAGCEIICVDNASTDRLDDVLRNFPVKKIGNTINRGYGAACNQGALAATGQFLFFMNPDVKVESDGLSALLEARRRYPDCSVFIPRTMTPSGQLWFDDRSGADRMLAKHAEVTTRSLAGDCCVRFADGGAFLIDRQMFLDVGGFDEKFFLYYEDDDFSHRLVCRGQPIIVVNDAVVTHAIGNSVAKSARSLIARYHAKKKSEIYFKHKYDIAYNPLSDGLFLVLKVLFYLLIPKPRRLFSALGQFKAVLDHMRGV